MSIWGQADTVYTFIPPFLNGTQIPQLPLNNSYQLIEGYFKNTGTISKSGQILIKSKILSWKIDPLLNVSMMPCESKRT